MSGDSNVLVIKKPTARSKISNGAALLMTEADGRSRASRRFRDILAEIVSDLGGADRLSEGQRQLARRCALMSVECERLEALAVAGEPFDIDTYGQLSDRMGRAFHRLGLRRAPRDVTPKLGDILKAKGPPR